MSAQVVKKHETSYPRQKRNTVLKAVISTGCIVLVILIVALARFTGSFFNAKHHSSPQSTQILASLGTIARNLDSIDTTNTTQYLDDFYTILALTEDPEPPEPQCEDMNEQKTNEERCEWVKEYCTDSESLIDYLKFSYCSIGSFGFFRKAASLVVFAVALVILLNVLASTSDIWFVSALTVVSTELRLSPAVAGLTLLSLANGAPDLITSYQAVQLGAAEGEIGLVLGSLAGAAMAIGCLVLGGAIIAASINGKSTRIGRGAFLRYMFGFTFCIVPSIGFCWGGVLKWYHGVIFMLSYIIFAAGSVIYLQRDEKKKRVIAREERKQAFIRTTTTYKLLNSSKDLNNGLLKDTDEQSDMSFHQSDKLTGEHVELNFLTGKPIGQQEYESSLATTNLTLDTGSTNGTNLVIPDYSTSPSVVNLAPVTRLDADPLSPLPPTPTVDDDDDSDDEDQTYYMAGLFFDPAWKKESEEGKRSQNPFSRNFSRALWFICWPFSLLRWLTIPSTDVRPDYLRGPKRIALHSSPFFFSLLVWVNFQWSPSEDKLKWGLAMAAGAAVTVALNLAYFFIVQPAVFKFNQKRAEMELYVDSKRDQHELTEDELHEVSEIVLKYNLDGDLESSKPVQMTIFMIFISSLAFCASIIWLALIANEIVSILNALGELFGLSQTFLGLTVLAIGNSIPDAASNISLAYNGKLPIAYSAIFSAPTLSSSFGLGLAVLITTLGKTDTIQYQINSQIKLCWIAVLSFIIICAAVFPWFYNYIPTKKFGFALCAFYGAFISIAIVLEATGK